MLRRRQQAERRVGLRRLRARRRGGRRLLREEPRRGERQRHGLRPARTSTSSSTAATPTGRAATSSRATAQILIEDENVGLDKASGAYYVVLTPYTTVGPQTYTAKADLFTRKGTNLAELEAAAPKGPRNYRASRDKFTSHSEPTIAMDPLDHNHLMAGSKMYENNDKYLFKIGTYESHDGGRTWEDQGQLPGYCQAPGECDPSNEGTYRTTSDISIDFDDEGNAYGSVLDAPGGTAAFRGFNMTAHIKRPGQPWSGPITVHDNRTNALTARTFLDDKNWIAVDNHTDVNGGPNDPNDGKIGTMYICWSFDGTDLPIQQIVVERSLDGGKTWGGITPGDNLPFPVSQKTLISGIGCDIAIGPKGEVYATWYDNQLNALMQAKSNNRGALWSPAVPIAGIAGVNSAFAGEAFRNLSLPATAVDGNGTIYVAAASLNAEGTPLLGNLLELGPQIKKRGDLDRRARRDARDEGREQHRGRRLQGRRRRRRADVGLGHRALQVLQRRALVHRPGARQPGPGQRRRRPVPARARRHAVRRGRHLVLRPPQRPVELLHRHVPRALAGRWADVHRPPRLAAHVGPGGQRADLDLGQVHRRLPGPRRRRRPRDSVLERHAAQQPAGERSGALALPGGLRRAHPAGPERGGPARADALRREVAEGRRDDDRQARPARDARPRRAPARPAGADGARRPALLRQGRRQRRSRRSDGEQRRLRGDDRARATSARASAAAATLKALRRKFPQLQTANVAGVYRVSREGEGHAQPALRRAQGQGHVRRDRRREAHSQAARRCARSCAAPRSSADAPCAARHV